MFVICVPITVTVLTCLCSVGGGGAVTVADGTAIGACWLDVYCFGGSGEMISLIKVVLYS